MELHREGNTSNEKKESLCVNAIEKEQENNEITDGVRLGSAVSGVEEPLACLPQAASSSQRAGTRAGSILDVDGVIHSIHGLLSSLLQFLSPSTYLDDVEFNLIVPRENITIRVAILFFRSTTIPFRGISWVLTPVKPNRSWSQSLLL
ncbi:hypothetical protein AFLA70_635g000291 [Aspergillus flavus AF70]|nr:hypothetical protein AFLA70_635g000291 [Aspergillus flavus AF70]